MMEFLNPLFIIGFIRTALFKVRMWQIRKHAPSAKRISLILSVSRKDYEAIPNDLKRDALFLLSDEEQDDEGNRPPDPKSQA